MALPDLSLAAQLWPAALGIALMSFTESVAAARTFCQRDDPPVNANRELLAVGAANVASALVGGLPAGAVLVSLLFLSPSIGLLSQANVRPRSNSDRWSGLLGLLRITSGFSQVLVRRNQRLRERKRPCNLLRWH